MGTEHRPWQARDEVLSSFGTTEREAQRRYWRFVFDGIGLGKRGDLGTGKGNRDEERVGEERAARGDSRILGQGTFVEDVLARAARVARDRVQVRRRRADLEGLLEFIGKEMGVTREEVLGGARRRGISEARSVFCYVSLRRLGLTGRQVSEALQMSSGGVHIACARGEALVRQNANLEDSLASYLNN